jgi:tetratricopeptide (TPR) repeat protein
MKAELWDSVKSRFLEAVSMGPQEQEAFLRALAQADGEISDLVRELLAQSPAQGPDLQRPCWSPGPAGIEAQAHTFEIGEKLLDRFEITGFLGEGGLGEVYRAFDHQQSLFIALKTLRAGYGRDSAAFSLLRKELNMARAVTHPNVCRLYDFHQAEDTGQPPFFTMELLEGETLAAHLRSKGPLTAAAAWPLAIQMLNALEAAHQRGIVHRDFKAANVMLTENASRAVVMDFGLARELARGADLQTTLSGNTFAGTPAYMAPEQLLGQRATFASDIHAFGVVLFEMVTGRRPFEGANYLEIASRRLNEEACSPRRYVSGLDRQWEYAIVRCLKRDAQERPQSVAEAKELFERAPPAVWLHRRTMIAGSAGVIIVAASGAIAATAPRRLSRLLEALGVRNRSAPDETGTANSVAMDYYVRGNTLLQEGTSESVHSAIDSFQRAVAVDPHFALAYASLSEAYLHLKNFGFDNDRELIRSAEGFAERAVTEGPRVAEGHAALGAVRQWQWNWADAEKSYDEALRLKPSFARARRWRAGLVLQFARFDEAISETRKAMDQDPFDRSAMSGFGLVLLFAGRYQEAVDTLKKGIGDRDMPNPRHNLCQAYIKLGSLSKGAEAENYFRLALAEAASVAAIERRSAGYQSELSSRMYALTYSARGQLQEAEPFLKKIEATVQSGREGPGVLAMIYACQNRTQEALNMVERAISVHDPFVLYLRVHVFLENLRGQPRFEALLRNLRLK